MQYRKEKEFIKKDGRHLIRGGPRDMQKRQQLAEMNSLEQDVIISTLREEISNLRGELSNQPRGRGGEFSAEELNDEVNKAVAQTITELKLGFEEERTTLKNNASRLNAELDHLKQKIMLMEKDHEMAIKEAKMENNAVIGNLKAKCDAQEDLISELKSALSNAGTRSEVPIEIDPDRPQMEEVFIDPLELGAGSGLESHIKVEDVSIDEKEDMADKVSKLKHIMGKLPVKHKPITEED
jgi:hypothetical protein